MSADHDPLVEALTVERYDQTWWRETVDNAAMGGPDTDLARARRRRDLADAYEATDGRAGNPKRRTRAVGA